MSSPLLDACRLYRQIVGQLAQLIALEVEGLVEVHGGSGVFVLPASGMPRRCQAHDPAPGAV